MYTKQKQGAKRVFPLVPPAILVLSVLAIPGGGLVAQAADEVTFARDVAPILQENCQECHRPASVAPMSLLTYEDARPWAPIIAEAVASRTMPPWPLDVTVGIQDFKNSRALSQGDIQTLVRWAEAGAPMGDVADLPPDIEWPGWTDTWAYSARFARPPDMVLVSPSYTVPPDGMDHWPTLVSYVDELDEPRWIKAMELRPGTPETRYVYHHANPSLRLPADAPDGMMGAGQLLQSAAGTTGFIFPENSGRLIQPGSSIHWAMHYFPDGEAVEAHLEIGVWFHAKGEEPEHETHGEQQVNITMATAGGSSPLRLESPELEPQMQGSWPDLVIPPHSTAMLRGIHVLDRPARIHSLRGHMHLRGKHQIVELVYPDGRWEVMNKLDWDHGWHTAFLYDDHAMPLLPTGTVIILTSVWDNTANNKYNPDPNQWVTGGDRSVDEMSHLRFGITYFTEEEFARLIEERQQLLAELERDGQTELQAARREGL